jgi:hypothetical protein
VVLIERKPQGGNTISIAHGMGYKTSYGHLDQIFAVMYQFIKRGQPIGRGGSTGSGARAYTHTHLTLYGPDYTPFLKGLNFQDIGNTTYFNSWRYPVDPELFSALAGCLAHPKSDIDLGTSLIERAKAAQGNVYQMIERLDRGRLLPSEKEELGTLLRHDTFADVFWSSKGIDIHLDRKVTFLYMQLNKKDPPFAEANVVLDDLVRLMKMMVPVLTAPVAK